MNPQISLNDYKAIVESTILDYLDQALEEQMISSERTEEIVSFAKDTLEKVEKIKERYPALKQPIESEIKAYEELEEHKII